MLQKLLTKAPLIAVLGAMILFVIVAGAGIGLSWPLLLALSTSIFAGAEGWLLWLTVRQRVQADKHLRHIRFIADRFQSLVRSAPCGYCLFTPQGLLREEHGVQQLLGAEKLSHLDDLIGGVKEGAELLAAFRKLQMTGEAFTMDIHPVQGDKDKVLPVIARRFRIGREGPHVDVLWFYDRSFVSVQAEMPSEAQAAARAAAVIPARKESKPQTTKAAVPPQAAVKQAETLAAAASVVAKPAPMQPSASQASSAASQQVVAAPPLGEVKPALWAKLFDLFSFPVWARSADFKIVLCNDAYCKAVAQSREEIVKHQLEIIPSSSKGGSGRAMAEAALKKGEKQVEREHVVVAGQRRLLQVSEILIPEAMRALQPDLALMGFAIDVTEEEEKEAELRRALAAHHEILEHLGAAIAVYGRDTRLEFYNRAYQQLWESEESFLDGKPTFGEILEDLRARRRIPDQADFQKYKKERLSLFTSLLEPREDVMYLPDGVSLRILTAPHPLGGLMFVHENVTDQLALETSYNTLMAVQRETIDNLSEGIAVFGPDGKLRLFNPALAKLWGLSVDTLAAEPHVADVLELVRPVIDNGDNWEEHKSSLVSYMLDRNPRAGRIERTDKKIIEYLTVPLPDGSVLDSYLDVTDTARVEQALRASNAALAEADRLKSDFVANVSYQLRTPLNTITGFAEILSEQYFGKLNERQLEYTTTIKGESEKLARLINDVLDLAMIEAGRMTLDRQAVSVAELLNGAKQMTAEWARQQSLEILIECPSDIGTFDVDEHRMKQVLFNLISNAIKYTPAGGHIALAAWKQDSWIVVSVLDTGVGIPDEDRERVFGKFEKANRALRQGGAGLGLSLVKSFVELHGGRVEILSDAQDGTRVSCFLPQKAPAKGDEGAALAIENATPKA